MSDLYQQCPRCALILHPRANYLTLDHCPRCLARAHRAVELVEREAREPRPYRTGRRAHAQRDSAGEEQQAR